MQIIYDEFNLVTDLDQYYLIKCDVYHYFKNIYHDLDLVYMNFHVPKLAKKW